MRWYRLIHKGNLSDKYTQGKVYSENYKSLNSRSIRNVKELVKNKPHNWKEIILKNRSIRSMRKEI